MILAVPGSEVTVDIDNAGVGLDPAGLAAQMAGDGSSGHLGQWPQGCWVRAGLTHGWFRRRHRG